MCSAMKLEGAFSICLIQMELQIKRKKKPQEIISLIWANRTC